MLDIKKLMSATGMSEDLAKQWLDPLNNTFMKFSINIPLRQAHFLAQVGHESGGFKASQESLNYSVDGLLKTFSRSRISESDVRKYGRTAEHGANQIMIANTVYGGEWGLKNLGNTQPQDGWHFRGSGLLQITGRANFTALEKVINEDVIRNPQLVAEDKKISALAAGWFWDSRNLNSLADKDDLVAITKRINGGSNGLEDRKERLEKAKKALGA